MAATLVLEVIDPTKKTATAAAEASEAEAAEPSTLPRRGGRDCRSYLSFQIGAATIARKVLCRGDTANDDETAEDYNEDYDDEDHDEKNILVAPKLAIPLPGTVATPRFSSSFSINSSKDNSDWRRKREVGGMVISLLPRNQGHECLGRRDRPFLTCPPDLNWYCGVDSDALAERVRARTVASLAPPATAVEETPSAHPTAAETPTLGTTSRTPLEAPSPSSMLIVVVAQDLRLEWATELNFPSTKTMLGCKGGGSGLIPRSPALVRTGTRDDNDNKDDGKYRDRQPRRGCGVRPVSGPDLQLRIRPRKIPSPVMSFRRMQRRLWVEEQAAILAEEDRAKRKAATNSVSGANALSVTRPAGGVVLDTDQRRRPSSLSNPFAFRRRTRSVSVMFVDTRPTSERFVIKFTPGRNSSSGDFDFHIND